MSEDRQNERLQAAEARAIVRREIRSNERCREVCDAIDALSVRLAQAEQALNDREIYAFGLEDKLEQAEVRLRVADALKREYEEALRRIAETARWYADNDQRLPLEVDHALCVEIVSEAENVLVVAASGGREAPDTKTDDG